METMAKNQPIFLQGRKTILRPFDRETDAHFLQVWFNDPDVRHFLINPFPHTLDEERQWLEQRSKDRDQIVLAIETKKGRLFIGTMGLHKINWVHKTAVTGAIIGNKNYWGKGYGTDAKMILLNYAFNTLGLHKITSSVIAYNERSLQYCLHCGYTEEGRLRQQIFKDGQHYDEVVLGVLEKNWQPIWQRYQKTGCVK